jgi:hypothetical protein
LRDLKMAEKTVVEKAGAAVGFGIAMAEDLAGAVKTAVGAAVTTVTEVLKAAPATNVVGKQSASKAPAKKAAKAVTKKAAKKASPKNAAKKTAAKKTVKKAPARKVAVKKAPVKKSVKKSARRR